MPQSDYTPSVASSGELAIKSSMLINGGAAVALLTFIGHILAIDNTNIALMHEFVCSLACFATGVLFAAVTAGITFFSRWQLGRNARMHNISLFVGISAIVVSYICFAVGVYISSHAFLKLVP